MNEGCPRLEELAGLLLLDSADPRRMHVDDCPRCRASLAVYQSFLDPGLPPEGTRTSDAHRRLKKIVQRAIRETPVGSRVGESVTGWRGLFQMAWRPSLGVVGIVVVVLVAFRLAGFPSRPGEDGRIIPRETQGQEATAPVLLEPEFTAGGEIILRWRAAPGADSYEVLLFGADLKERKRLGAGSDSYLRLRPDQLRGNGILSETDSVLFWVVSAKSGGDEIARSDPGFVRTR